MMLDSSLTVVDLFCGAGGMSRGFCDAGFEILLAIDRDRVAVETYSKNFPHPVAEVDLSLRQSLPKSTVIVGGPPCQGFSSAGARRVGDPRNSLVARFAEILVEQRPEAFVFENVEGFLTGHAGAHVLELVEPLIAAGYRIHLRKVNAANYGVPQHRKRVIAIGGLGWDPHFPEPTHSAYGAPGASNHVGHLPRCPSLSDALLGLPKASPSGEGSPQGHIARRLAHEAQLRAELLRPGMTMRDLPSDLQHHSYRRRSNRRVCDGMATERRGGAPAGVRRLLPGEPSKAITSGARSEFLHPSENRNLTIRECARLQTFPDDFVFMGNSSDQALLVGNAVPPLLAFRIARSLRDDLLGVKVRHGAGTLLSFVPTTSTGMSPALRKTMQLVSSQSTGIHAQKEFNFASI